MTSFGVVARLRRVLTAQAKAQATPGNPAPKRVKVGHTGTLDPFATGLMILVVGKECKNAQRYSKLSKVYQATITLGATSSTGDPEGTITPQAGAVPPSMQQVQQVLQRLTGQILQRPPAFSALTSWRARARRRYWNPGRLPSTASSWWSTATPGSPYAHMSVAALIYAAWQRTSAERWAPGRTVVTCDA